MLSTLKLCSKCLSAWWPLKEGPADIYIYMYYDYLYGWSGYQCRSVAHSGSSSIKSALPSDRLANLSELEMDTTPQKSAESAALSVKEEDVTPMAVRRAPRPRPPEDGEPDRGGAAPDMSEEEESCDAQGADELVIDDEVLVLRGGKIKQCSRDVRSVVLRVHKVKGSQKKMWRIRTSSSEACAVLTGKSRCYRPLNFKKDRFFEAFRAAVGKIEKDKPKEKTAGAKSNMKRGRVDLIDVEMPLADGEGSYAMVVEASGKYCSVEATVDNVKFIASYY